MIKVETLWERLSVLTKTGTSGYFTAAEFNSNLYSVQYAILSLLCDNYENNQKVTDALINHIISEAVVSTTGGKLFASSIIETYEDYYRTLAINYRPNVNEEYAAHKITVNAIGMTLSSPIRKPNLTKNKTLYYFTDGNITMLPKQSNIPVNFIYCKKPSEAKIAFTTAEDDDNDYLVLDIENTIDIEFPEGLFNLFVYFMLESMGIEQRENLAQSFSELAINRTVQTDVK